MISYYPRFQFQTDDNRSVEKLAARVEVLECCNALTVFNHFIIKINDDENLWSDISISVMIQIMMK